MNNSAACTYRNDAREPDHSTAIQDDQVRESITPLPRWWQEILYGTKMYTVACIVCSDRKERVRLFTLFS